MSTASITDRPWLPTGHGFASHFTRPLLVFCRNMAQNVYTGQIYSKSSWQGKLCQGIMYHGIYQSLQLDVSMNTALRPSTVQHALEHLSWQTLHWMLMSRNQALNRIKYDLQRCWCIALIHRATVLSTTCGSFSTLSHSEMSAHVRACARTFDHQPWAQPDDRSWLLRPSLPWAIASGQVAISHSGLAASSVKVPSAVFCASVGQQAHVTEKARLTSPLLVAAPGVPLG